MTPLRPLSNPASLRLVLHGVCQRGARLLEGLGDLLRTPAREALIAMLAEWAPTGLVQFPSLLMPARRARLNRELLGMTRDRMVRGAL